MSNFVVGSIVGAGIVGEVSSIDVKLNDTNDVFTVMVDDETFMKIIAYGTDEVGVIIDVSTSPATFVTWEPTKVWGVKNKQWSALLKSVADGKQEVKP